MRAIDKGAAPPCLADRQRELERKVKETGRPPEPGDWEPKDCAQALREALWRDQFGLCGYCTQRIETTPHVDGKIPPSRGMRIEHIVTREDEAARMYEWANLLGVCGGRSSSAAGVSYDHCDRARGDQPLHIDPTRKTPDPESAFDYHRAKNRRELLIAPASGHEHLAEDIEVLKLNSPAIARRRREAELQIAHELAKLKDSKKQRRFLERRLAAATTPDSTGTLPEFAPVVARYVRKKLAGQTGPAASSHR